MAVVAPAILFERLAQGPASAAELARTPGASQSTLSRWLRPLERSGQVVRFGTTRRARYGLARTVGTVGSAWPLYRIDETGASEEIATVHAIAPERYFVRGEPACIEGMLAGLPYYLQDRTPAPRTTIACSMPGNGWLATRSSHRQRCSVLRQDRPPRATIRSSAPTSTSAARGSMCW